MSSPAHIFADETRHVAEPSGNAGSAMYTPWALHLYDLWVLWFATLFAWKCSTSKVLLPLFQSTMGEKHLDIGVATGYYPATCIAKKSSCKEITLVDLNPASLEAAKRRIMAVSSSIRINTIIADATESLPLAPSEKFNSITMFYLLHCIPGPPERKTRAFDVARQQLATNGVLAGATVLGTSRPMNWLAGRIMSFYNKRGAFDNWDDTEHVFAEGLRRNFEEVEVWGVGRTMLFTARKPRVQQLQHMM
ncbi:Fc.00g037950.m01.CDS01 [Cosmosporella sp. VM-42]